MKNTPLLLILLILGQTGTAQKLNDRFEYKVTYELTYKLDSTALEPKSEYMILYTGEKLSKFSSRAKALANPIVRNANSAATSRAAITDFQYEILKDRNSNKLFFTHPVGRDNFYFTQELDKFIWEILPDKKNIKEFQVQKATTSFAGRDYIAWFTTEIPYPDGPYKFSGLPGLILELEDTRQHYIFEFFGLEKHIPKIDYKINLKYYAETSKSELEKLWRQYKEDPMGYNNNPNITMSDENRKKLAASFKAEFAKQNNPLELE